MIEKRSLGTMAVLFIVTLGFYLIYWLVVTKDEINSRGAQIPTGWLAIIPFANIYFLYKYAEGFARFILRDESQTVPYFLLLLLVLPIGMFIVQDKLNTVA